MKKIYNINKALHSTNNIVSFKVNVQNLLTLSPIFNLVNMPLLVYMLIFLKYYYNLPIVFCLNLKVKVKCCNNSNK